MVADHDAWRDEMPMRHQIKRSPERFKTSWQWRLLGRGGIGQLRRPWGNALKPLRVFH